MLIKVPLLSTYRSQIMGLCMISVMLCHARLDGAFFPNCVLSILDYLNTGVDVFLLLSGLGMFFSLNKAEKCGTFNCYGWIKKRLFRILIPYLIIEIPFWLYYCVNNKLGIGDFFYYISMISFWVDHIGVWFLALIIPLYIVTPLIHNLLKKINYNFGVVILFVALPLVLSVLPISSSIIVINNIIDNIQIVICRVPCYIIGLYWGNLIVKKRDIHVVWLIFTLFLFVALRFVPIISSMYRGWLLAICIAVCLSYLFDNLKNFSFVQKTFVIIGNATLSIYVSYDVMKNSLHGSLGDGTIFFVLSILCGLVLGILYYYLELSVKGRLKTKS